MPLYLYGNENNPVIELDEELNVYITVENLNENTSYTNNDIVSGFRIHDTFGHIELGRINLKDSFPPSIKNTNVVWIMRGQRQRDGATITWRSPDTPSDELSGEPVVNGSIKVVGYFYEE